MQSHPATLVLGGVRSGKSRYALQRVSAAPQVTFIATAQALDEEMQERILHHKEERPAHWHTIEEPLRPDLALELASQRDGMVVIDCLTLYVSNLMGLYGENQSSIREEFERFCAALSCCDKPLILVSNEVGSGVVPAFEMGRVYRDLLGELNQRVAAIVGEVVVMIAGLPLHLKGKAQ